MANIAQLVRALVCGAGGRGFKPHYSPQIKALSFDGVFTFLRLRLSPRTFARSDKSSFGQVGGFTFLQRNTEIIYMIVWHE